MSTSNLIFFGAAYFVAVSMTVVYMRRTAPDRLARKRLRKVWSCLPKGALDDEPDGGLFGFLLEGVHPVHWPFDWDGHLRPFSRLLQEVKPKDAARRLQGAERNAGMTLEEAFRQYDTAARKRLLEEKMAIKVHNLAKVEKYIALLPPNESPQSLSSSVAALRDKLLMEIEVLKKDMEAFVT